MKQKAIIPILLATLLPLSACGTSIESPAVYSDTSQQVEYGKEDYKQVVSASNKFGFNLFAEIKDNPDENVFISPASAFLALSMAYNGADGETKAEIAEVLQLENGDLAPFNKANASLVDNLSKNTKKIDVRIGNSIWLNEKYHFQEEFAINQRDYYSAEIREINVTDKNSSKLINEWVKEATNNKIESIAPRNLDPYMVAMLINAIYFNGKWKHEFDKKNTEERPFYKEDGTKKEVSLMRLNKKLNYLETDEFQAVKLPYGEDEMSMTVYLPKEGTTLEEFKSTLTNDTYQQWNGEFRQKGGTVFLPKFKIEYEKEISKELIRMGMTTAFGEVAEFSNMVKEDIPIWISEVKQKTFINVTEEGTEAAAATAIVMKTESAEISEPFYIEVNKPFFFTIEDNESGTILFMGSVMSP